MGLALPFILLRLLWKSRLNPHYRHHLLERLGFIPFHLPHCQWIHAVSVGEVITATPLIHALLKENPSVPLLITVTTPTGRERVHALFGHTVHVCYLPYDLNLFFWLFIHQVNPKSVIIMETELWPNLLAFCRRRHIPSLLVNGRLSSHSARKYMYVKPLIQSMLKNIHQIAVRNNKDAKRFLHLGLNKSKLCITGNLKFDLSIPKEQHPLTATIKSQTASRPIWIAASTHDGEEKYIIAAHRQLLKKIPDLLLILVPRHKERFNKVYNLLIHSHLDTVKSTSKTPITPQTEVLLGDQMGKLLAFYAASDVAFVGGSFVATGGHNILEPAALNIPVIVGPYTFNFPEIIDQFMHHQALIKVPSAAELSDHLFTLLMEPTTRQTMAANATRMIQQNQGALKKVMVLIKQLNQYR